MSALVEVEHLKKYFKTPRGMLHAVDDVSFSIDAGKTLGVVGESGCGKSTLLNILGLLDNPTSEFVVRQICCSAYQVNDKWLGHPNIKCVSRIAGDPNNENKPLPQMDLLL